MCPRVEVLLEYLTYSEESSAGICRHILPRKIPYTKYLRDEVTPVGKFAQQCLCTEIAIPSGLVNRKL